MLVFTLVVTILTMHSVQSVVSAAVIVECSPVTVEIELTKWISIELDTGIRVCDIVELRNKNFKYGEMALAYGLAAESGRPVSEILDMRYDEKMGWGKIAHRLGVKVSDARHRAASVLDKSGLSGESSELDIYLEINIDNSDDSHDHGKGNPKGKHK